MDNNNVINTNSKNFIKDYNFTPINENLKLTSIVILTYNQLDYTKLCIESIKKFTPSNTYEIIVVDNNSTDGTPNWLKNQPDLKVIYNKENKGFPAGCNQGIKISKGDNILLLNNDTIVTPNWLNNLQKALYSSDKIGAVGAVSNNCSNYQKIETTYNNISEMLDFAIKYNVSNENQWKLKTKLIGYCYLIKRSVLDKVGLLDERFSPGNFEDDDHCYRVICEGYKLLLCVDTFIHHFGSVSFNQSNSNFSNILNVNAQKFKEKWGFDSSYSSCIRLDLINFIQENENKNLNVLEVGCATGSSLLEIKNRYKNANLYGLEISKGSGNVAKNLCNCIIGNIENEVLPYEENFFDYIIFGDVLEHLTNPWEILSKMKKYLKKDGFVIASLPNIMHVSVLFRLLNGYFTYTDAGILDKTHLRFFTLSEIENLFSSSDYIIESKSASIVPISKDDEEFINKLCSISGEEFRQQYSSYQYIVKASPSINLDEFQNDIVISLRRYLLNLDTNIDVEDSLNNIFEIYNSCSNSFEFYINYLINNTLINKLQVKNRILLECRRRNLNIFIKL